MWRISRACHHDDLDRRLWWQADEWHADEHFSERTFNSLLGPWSGCTNALHSLIFSCLLTNQIETNDWCAAELLLLDEELFSNNSPKVLHSPYYTRTMCLQLLFLFISKCCHTFPCFFIFFFNFRIHFLLWNVRNTCDPVFTYFMAAIILSAVSRL